MSSYIPCTPLESTFEGRLLFLGGRQRARGAQRRLGICYCLNAAKILIKRSWYSIVIFPLVIHTKFIIKR